MMLLPPPMVRSFADKRTLDRTADALVGQILTAYDNLGSFHGRGIHVPGSCVCDDAWRAALELDLEGRSLAAIEAFSLEAWLASRVETEGSPEQRERFASMLSTLDDQDYGLPDNLADLISQPLLEVEVYRGMSDDFASLALEEDDEEEDESC
ncbi:hypothetical protein CTAYLR_010677 [Chrysophaeum taylorii]|uniref:Uncharacterized protein n=1 Tax=Chrysophaeum taylorii TaxID=2483200 RepID=A0AAD7XED7_9STRA|nr:hypothetical protein CTAYLR_010677 [Chrysophaeum taylorii]